MDLKNLLPHMRGQAVRVNGTNYLLDNHGVAHNVKPEDAKKLLGGKSWRLVESEEPESLLLDDKGEPLTDEGEGEGEEGEKEGEDEGGEEGEGEEGEGVDVTEGEPEPDESMDIEELKAMADGFDVAYGQNIGKALLVERIREAMAETE